MSLINGCQFTQLSNLENKNDLKRENHPNRNKLPNTGSCCVCGGNNHTLTGCAKMIEHQITKTIADINKTVEELQKTRDMFQNHITAADINNNFVDENRCLILENSELKKRNAALEKEISDMKIASIVTGKQKMLS